MSNHLLNVFLVLTIVLTNPPTRHPEVRPLAELEARDYVWDIYALSDGPGYGLCNRRAEIDVWLFRVE